MPGMIFIPAKQALTVFLDSFFYFLWIRKIIWSDGYLVFQKVYKIGKVQVIDLMFYYTIFL